MPRHVDFIRLVHLAPITSRVAVELGRVPLDRVDIARVDRVDCCCSVQDAVDQPSCTCVASLALRLLDKERH